MYIKGLLVDVQIPEDLPPEEGVKDVRVGDDNDEDEEDDDDGEGGAAADNQNLYPHLARMVGVALFVEDQPNRFLMQEDRCHMYPDGQGV